MWWMVHLHRSWWVLRRSSGRSWRMIPRLPPCSCQMWMMRRMIRVHGAKCSLIWVWRCSRIIMNGSTGRLWSRPRIWWHSGQSCLISLRSMSKRDGLAVKRQRNYAGALISTPCREDRNVPYLLTCLCMMISAPWHICFMPHSINAFMLIRIIIFRRALWEGIRMSSYIRNGIKWGISNSVRVIRSMWRW